MLLELVVALVLLVDGQPEGLGIAAVDGDGEAEAARRGPHRLEPGIVDGDDLAIPILPVETERLGDLEAVSAHPRAGLEGLGDLGGEGGILDGLGGVDVVHVEDEAPFALGVEALLGRAELLGGAARGEVHRAGDEVGVHRGQRLGDGVGADVAVHVDDGERAAPGGVGLDVLRETVRAAEQAQRQGGQDAPEAAHDGRYTREGARRVTARTATSAAPHAHRAPLIN
jgi:hypothetical protein